MRKDAANQTKKWMTGKNLILLFSILFALFSFVWLFDWVQQLAQDWEMGDTDFFFSPSNDGQTEQPLNVATPAGKFPISAEMLQPWSGTERLNMLLLGVDVRCGEVGPMRTDTLMLLTLDPVTPAAAIISIPRDLWVEIPGFGVNRVNQAYYFGEVNEYPGGGAALAMETVEGILGVSIDEYLLVDFNAFIDSVDLIGGIDIDVPEEIEDATYPDSCYGYDPFYVKPGTQHFDGERALKYARTRATYGGDVDRAGRQQEVLLAIRNKTLQLNMIPQLISQSRQMWQTFQTNIKTSFTLEELIQLALLVQDISEDHIETAVIDYNYVRTQTTPDGQQVLIPIRENIRTLRDRIFTPLPIPPPQIENLMEKVAVEGARVGIFNGTSIYGLAGETEDYLTLEGFQITHIGNADSSTYQTIQMIDYGTHPYTTLALMQLMDIPPLNLSHNDVDQPEQYDILLILGNAWSLPDTPKVPITATP